MTDAAAMTEDTVSDPGRRKFLTAATSATAAVGVVFAATPFVESWAPSERAKALGVPISLPIDKLDPGQMLIVTWRKQPIYVIKRTPEMVAKLAANDSQLKDPTSKDSEQPAYATNEMRSRRADIAVLIGICTHLGCLPKQFFDAGDPAIGTDWPGGFRCPCHGSRFDMAGRVFDGSPASTNLRIPPYNFPDAATLRIGDDGTTSGAG